MTKDNFKQALSLVLVHEGGYSNHPADPGGATNKGITQRVYDSWRQRLGRPTRSVREIVDSEVEAIYKAQYWNVSRCDQLPAGLDYAVFDFSVNSGPGRAAKFLQQIVNVTADGQIGEITLEAVRTRDPATVAAALCDARLSWLKTLRTWSTFGRGWGRRVAEVKSTSVSMADGERFDGPTSFAAITGKAGGAETVSASLVGTLKDPAAVTALGGVLGSFVSLANTSGPVQWVVSGVIAAAGVVGVVWLVRKIRA